MTTKEIPPHLQELKGVLEKTARMSIWDTEVLNALHKAIDNNDKDHALEIFAAYVEVNFMAHIKMEQVLETCLAELTLRS